MSEKIVTLNEEAIKGGKSVNLYGEVSKRR